MYIRCEIKILKEFRMAHLCDYYVGFNSNSHVYLVTEESFKEVFNT